MPHYFCKLNAPRPTFAFDMNDAEKALMGEHAAYWMSLLNDGTVLLFGPVMDPSGPFGMGVMAAADEAEARRHADADPVVRAGVGFKVEITPMHAVTRASNG